jgi:hypothetical protein
MDLEAISKLKIKFPFLRKKRNPFEGRNSSNINLLHKHVFVPKGLMFVNKFSHAKVLIGP